MNGKKTVTISEIQEFVNCLNETDEYIIDAFQFMLDGRVLSESETKEFLQFIRSELNLKR